MASIAAFSSSPRAQSEKYSSVPASASNRELGEAIFLFQPAKARVSRHLRHSFATLSPSISKEALSTLEGFFSMYFFIALK